MCACVEVWCFITKNIFANMLRSHIPSLLQSHLQASNNNFELAITITVGKFDIDSEHALAKNTGPLIEDNFVSMKPFFNS